MLPLGWVTANFPDLSNVAAIGPGGQKYVYSCDHPTDGPVVLKILHAHVDQNTLDREILAVDQVQSPRVPRIFETGRVSTPVGDSFWIREERVDGQTLRQRLSAGPLSPAELLRLATQMLEALAAAETANIVHRDVKPENIIVDASGDFWLLDFGIARHLTMRSLTADARVFGKFTLGYAPIEQIRNIKGQIDGRADMFALGMTLVEASTGANPFVAGAATDQEVLNRTDLGVVPRVVVALRDASGFADLIEVMTKRRRDQRCPTVQDALSWINVICAREQAP